MMTWGDVFPPGLQATAQSLHGPPLRDRAKRDTLAIAFAFLGVLSNLAVPFFFHLILWQDHQPLVCICVHPRDERSNDSGSKDFLNPLYAKGQDKPIHVVWEIPKGASLPAVLITAYRPDPEQWKDDLHAKGKMTTRRKPKFIHEEQHVAKLSVELIHDNTGRSPYLGLKDAYRLDDVRSALRHGDIKSASKLALIFAITPVGP